MSDSIELTLRQDQIEQVVEALKRESYIDLQVAKRNIR